MKEQQRHGDIISKEKSSLKGGSELHERTVGGTVFNCCTCQTQPIKKIQGESAEPKNREQERETLEKHMFFSHNHIGEEEG